MSSDQSKLVKRLYTYKKKWEFEPELKDWIKEVEGLAHQAYCKYCKRLLHPHKKDLLDHAKTKKHKKNIAEALLTGNTIEPLIILGKNVEDQILEPARKRPFLETPPRKTKEADIDVRPTCSFSVDTEYFNSILRRKVELKVACFMVERGDSLRELDELGAILSSAEDCGPEFKDISLHPTKLTALIVNVVAPSMHKQLLKDIGSGYYSLIIRECFDILPQKFIAVVIKYVSKSLKQIVTTFYKFIPVYYLDVYSIKNVLCETIVKDGLYMEKCIGLGIDGVSPMVDPHVSVYSLFKQKVNHVQLITCVCHSLNWAGSRASEMMPSQLEFLVREIFIWFSISSERMETFRKIFKKQNDEYLLEILQPVETRWLSRGECITLILDQWDKLKRNFNSTEENCQTAEILSDLMNDPTNKLYLIFLKPIINELNKINNLFQNDDKSIIKPINELVNYYRLILKKIVIPKNFSQISTASELINFQFEDYLSDSCAMAFEHDFTVECLNVDPVEIQTVKANCKLVLIKIAKELHYRMPMNINLFKKLELLHPNKALQPNPPSVASLATEFINICKEVELAEHDWNNLIFMEWTEKEDEASFWLEVANSRNSDGEQLYGHISDLALALLCLPVSNSTVESIFKSVNEMKCKISNRWQLNTANSFLQVKFNLQRIGEHCATFHPQKEMLNKVDDKNYQIEEYALLQ